MKELYFSLRMLGNENTNALFSQPGTNPTKRSTIYSFDPEIPRYSKGTIYRVQTV